MNENFSVLERYGENFTEKEYITNPAIGREKQIQELLLILLTPEKSAILIGKPGIGKTAIVEGLAWRMQKGEVPDALQGYTIINIKTASLLGTMPNGESKVQIMIDELKTKDKVILFVDEVHMLIGATDSSSLDFANIFKEGLGRGSIKVIGATTTEEYERYILRDKAFTRRFQKVEVPEPTRDETVQIMMGTLPKIEKTTGAKMKYTSFVQSQLFGFIVDATSEYKRVYAIGSRYPDIALTIMKQAFSRAIVENRKDVTVFDIRDAIQYSKNIYPDVIKKELPKFDEMFKDIIKEENGEETGLEWKNQVNPDMERIAARAKPVAKQEVKEKPRIDLTENKTVKLPHSIKKDFVNEADKMLLSGKINEITENGYVLNKDSLKTIYKYDDITRLPSMEFDQIEEPMIKMDSILPFSDESINKQKEEKISKAQKEINKKEIKETQSIISELDQLLKPVSIYDPNDLQESTTSEEIEILGDEEDSNIEQNQITNNDITEIPKINIIQNQDANINNISNKTINLTLSTGSDDLENKFDDFFEEE